MRINFSDPTLPFGEDPLPTVASVVLEARTDGSPTTEALDGINAAVGISIDLLRQDRLDTGRSIGSDADPLNPLELTEREAAITAAWAVESAARTDEADEEARESTLGTRIAAGVLAATGVGGGFAMVGGASIAAAQPNQIPAPAAKVAQPFNFAAESQITAEDSTTTTPLTPAQQKQCAKIAVSGIVRNPDPENGIIMHRAGIRPGTPGAKGFETVDGGYAFAPMPDGTGPDGLNCDSVYRSAKSLLQIQNVNHRSRYMLLDKQPAFPVRSRPGADLFWVGPSFAATGADYLFNQCPDGKHWLKVRDIETLLARDVQTHKLLASHTYHWRAKIQGSCAAAARSARLVTGFGVPK